MPLSIEEYLSRDPATSKQIQAGTGMSQTAVSRQLRSMGDRIIKLPGGRSPRYAITCNAFGADDKLPLFMVDPHGNNTSVATIRPLAHGGFFVQESPGMPSVLLSEGKNGLYEDLPYFLDDLKPQGFLGRQIATELSEKSDDFPPNPEKWNANHIGRYLISNGDDLPGNFRLGQQAHLRARRKPLVTTARDYPFLADDVISGIIQGSSAGGEQPKFTTFCGDRSVHVIVKFSPKGDNPAARRWRDILITEHHATEALHHFECPAAETRLIEGDDRLFLESQRFDRSGEYGRMPMISLQAIDAEFTGIGSSWPQVIDALHKQSLISWKHAYDAEFLWAFGRLINNTDMHLGNLSFSIDESIFRLLPVYDMCSMGFSPRAGEVPPCNFSAPVLKGINLKDEDIQGAKQVAHYFWERVANDGRISDEFKVYLDQGNPIQI